jgi:phage terminase large subunit
MVRVQKRGQRLWIEELIYETGLTNEDIYQRLVKLRIPSTATILADAAEPKTIETLRRLGYRNITPASKGPDSVRAGIDKLRTFEVHVHPESSNLIQEYYNYAYRGGTDKPIDDYNHLMDALRYALSRDKGSSRKYVVMGSQRPQEEIL